MCLNNIVSNTQDPSREEIRYKTLLKNSNNTFSSVMYVVGDYTVGEEMECDLSVFVESEEFLRIYGYIPGWHVFLTEEGAQEYKAWGECKEEVVVKVKVRHFLAQGEDGMYNEDVAESWKYMTILKEVK